MISELYKGGLELVESFLRVIRVYEFRNFLAYEQSADTLNFDLGHV